ncbi:MAG: precorrin-6y C5,15-methyltransferase (decarboxylating) subunit CbiE [Desulfovibrio sp.]|nr:precorrin-6y C5,15-methyltransferase (decarboxylating) subunit CbiE [Desulfovibrio sp.]
MRGVKAQGLLPGLAPPKKRGSGKKTASGGAAPVPPTANDLPASSEAALEIEKDGGENAWPPMSEMLHSLLVSEPAAERPPRPSAPDSPPPDSREAHPVVVLGLDCACAELNAQQRQLLADAELICAGRPLLERVAEKTGDPDMGGRAVPFCSPVEPVFARMAEARAAGRRVLVLADGDPLFFGLGASLVRRLGREAVRVIPAVSSMQWACARLGLPWHGVVNVSLHGRDNFVQLNAVVGLGVPVCVLTDGEMRPDVVAAHLLDRGVDWFEVHVFELLNFPDETACHVLLTEAAAMTFGPSCTMVLIPAGAPRRPYLGLDDSLLAAEGGLVTKLPVRAAALAMLRIMPGHTVWDIGAGSGSVALEASVLAHPGRVVAVEKKAERVVCIEENRRRFGAASVDIVSGEAPACLENLPDPHRVFIGGGLSGKNASADREGVLAQVCRRLPTGGRVAINCVLLDTLARCRDFFQTQGWPCDVVCLQAAQSAPLGHDEHLVGMNPVFVLAAQKPQEPKRVPRRSQPPTEVL